MLNVVDDVGAVENAAGVAAAGMAAGGKVAGGEVGVGQGKKMGGGKDDDEGGAAALTPLPPSRIRADGMVVGFTGAKVFVTQPVVVGGAGTADRTGPSAAGAASSASLLAVDVPQSATLYRRLAGATTVAGGAAGGAGGGAAGGSSASSSSGKSSLVARSGSGGGGFVATAVNSAEIAEAYRVACLGVTESDWRELGLRALQVRRLARSRITRAFSVFYLLFARFTNSSSYSLFVIDRSIAALQCLETGAARQAFVRVRDTRAVELVASVERACGLGSAGAGASSSSGSSSGGSQEALAGALVLAFQARYAEAAKLFGKAGQPARAVEMYAAASRPD